MDMKTKWWIGAFLCLICVSTVMAQDQPSKAQPLYESAAKLYENGKIDEALRLAEQGAKRDRYFAPVFALLTELNLEKDNPRAKMRASDAIRWARRLEPENVDYQALFARVQRALSFMPGQRSYVQNAFENALELDSTHVGANAGFSEFLDGELRYFRQKMGSSGYVMKIPESLLGEQEQFSKGMNYVDFSGADGGENMIGPLMYSENDMLRLYDDNIIEYVRQYYQGEIPSPKNLSLGVSEAKMEEVSSWDYEQEVKKLEDELIAAAGNALFYDAGNPQARLSIWRNLLPSKRYDELLRITKPFIALDRTDPMPLMVTGLIQFKQKQRTDAKKSINQAMALLSAEERDRMESITLFLTAEEMEEYQTLSAEQQTQAAEMFWREHEPMFLRGAGERQLEHICRVIEADIRFGEPDMEIRGSDTDRGRTLIRYGSPHEVKQFSSDIPLMPLRVNGIPLNPMGNGGNSWVVWYYPEYTFVFQSDGLVRRSNRYSFSQSIAAVDFEAVATDIAEKTPEASEFARDRGLFNFPWYTATFRGEGDKTQLEVYYGIPLAELSGAQVAGGYRAQVKRGVFLHSKDWQPRYQDAEEVAYVSQTPPDTASQDLIIDLSSLQVDAGDYKLAVEVEDQNNLHTAIYRDSISIPEYGHGALQVSDLLIASFAEDQPTAGDYLRHGLRVVPHAGRYFALGEPISIYYEIYNLKTSDTPFKSNWEMQYTVNKVPPSKNQIQRLGRWFTSVLGGGDEEREIISVRTEYEGNQTDEYQFLELRPEKLETGEYLLTVSIRDLTSEESAAKSQRFWVGPSE
jgi:GWxTD domain-containing protein